MSVIEYKTNKIKHAKQQIIVDVALELMENIGINSITMERIALAADYTKRTLYTYFKSKDEILLWLYIDDLNRRWNYQMQQLSNAKTGIEKLNIWAITLFEFCESNNHTLQIQKYMDYQFVNIDRISEPVFERYKKINNELAEGLQKIVKTGIKDGSFREDIDIGITINQFLNSYLAILNKAFSESYSFADFDKYDYIYHYLNLFIKSLAA